MPRRSYLAVRGAKHLSCRAAHGVKHLFNAPCIVESTFLNAPCMAESTFLNARLRSALSIWQHTGGRPALLHSYFDDRKELV